MNENKKFVFLYNRVRCKGDRMVCYRLFFVSIFFCIGSVFFVRIEPMSKECVLGVMEYCDPCSLEFFSLLCCKKISHVTAQNISESFYKRLNFIISSQRYPQRTAAQFIKTIFMYYRQAAQWAAKNKTMHLVFLYNKRRIIVKFSQLISELVGDVPSQVVATQDYPLWWYQGLYEYSELITNKHFHIPSQLSFCSSCVFTYVALIFSRRMSFRSISADLYDYLPKSLKIHLKKIHERECHVWSASLSVTALLVTMLAGAFPVGVVFGVLI